jgi:hypothetical protein
VIDRVRAALAARGQAVWVDVVDITGGAQWRERVKRGIEACKALIFVISPDSVASDACRAELEDAVALNKLVYRDVPAEGLPRCLPLRSGCSFATVTTRQSAWTGWSRRLRPTWCSAISTPAWPDAHANCSTPGGTPATRCAARTCGRPRHGWPARRGTGRAPRPSNLSTSRSAVGRQAAACTRWSPAAREPQIA